MVANRNNIENSTSAVRLTGAWLAPELMPVKCLQFQYLQPWGPWMILILNWCTWRNSINTVVPAPVSLAQLCSMTIYHPSKVLQVSVPTNLTCYWIQHNTQLWTLTHNNIQYLCTVQEYNIWLRLRRFANAPMKASILIMQNEPDTVTKDSIHVVLHISPYTVTGNHHSACCKVY